MSDTSDWLVRRFMAHGEQHLVLRLPGYTEEVYLRRVLPRLWLGHTAGESHTISLSHTEIKRILDEYNIEALLTFLS